MTGLQMVSPSGGWGVDGLTTGAGLGNTDGSGGGPAAGIDIVGKGGGITRGAAAFGSSVIGGPDTTSATAAGPGSDFAVGNAAKNSEIGFHADFASSHARSVALREPSATFSRMADSEKRPAYCPFR